MDLKLLGSACPAPVVIVDPPAARGLSVVLAGIRRPTGLLGLTRIAGLLVAATAVRLLTDGAVGLVGVAVTAANR